MKTNKIILLLFVLFLLVGIAIADESAEEAVEDDSSSFDSENFDYIDGDYSDVDWSKVDWTQIPPNRVNEIPAEELKYTELNPDQRHGMSTEQIIPNLENIENLASDVDENNARKAIKQQTGVNVISLGKSASIEGHILKADIGSFDFTAKTGWEIKVDENGVIKVLNPSTINEASISNQDSFNLDQQTTMQTNSGKSILVDNINFRNGQAYSEADSTSTVGDYYLPSFDNEINIYFDSSIKPEGNYVMFTEEGLEMAAEKGAIVNLIPLPGNRLFNMVKRDYSTDPPTLVPDERDTLTITVKDGDGIKVSSRQEFSKTPLIEHHEGGGKVIIGNGRMDITINDGKLMIDPPKAFEGDKGPINMENGIAFEIVSDSETIKDTLRTSSSNRFVLLRDGKQIAGNNAGLEVSDSIEPNMMKSIEDLKHKYPKINFEMEKKSFFDIISNPFPTEGYDDITANMAQITDQWLRDKPGISKYYDGISFEAEFNAAAVKDADSRFFRFGERAFDSSTMLKHPIRDLESPLEIIDHEFMHMIGHYVNDKEDKFGKTTTEEYLDTKYNEIAFSTGKSLFQSNEFHEFIYDLNLYDTQNNPEDIDYMKNIIESETDPKKKEMMIAEYNEITIGEYQKFFEKAIQETNPEKQKKNINRISSIESHLRKKVEEENDWEDEEMRTYHEERRIEAKKLHSRFNKLVRDQTSLYPYSFRYYNPDFSEMPTTFHENTPKNAARNKDLAQIEYDYIMSVDPPSWLEKEAEERYYSIMGSKDGAYCKANPCGPCLIYKLTCAP